MQLRNLDLNLMVLLDALLAERSVTRAAARVGLAQPTMSTALARLRRHFSDELLARSGNSFELTPLAVQLRPVLATALAGADRLFSTLPDFDAASADREFTILSSDYGVATVGPALARVMAEEAPSARLRLASFTIETLDDAHDALRTVDALLMPHGVVHDLPHLDLLTDEWVGVVDDRSSTGAGLTMGDLTSRTWVATAASRGGPSALGTIPVLRQLELLGVRPSVAVTAETFLAVPLLIAGTDRLAVVPRRLAAPLAAPLGLRLLPLPFEAVPLVEAAWWHPVHERDAGHRWLRRCLVQAAARLADGLRVE